jgi:hypothetical protein
MSRNSRNPGHREPTPLKHCIVRDVTSDDQQLQGSGTSGPTIRASAKRKREDTGAENEKQSKRLHTSKLENHEHCVAAVASKKASAPLKEVKGKTIIDTKLSEEKKRELRAAKFAKPGVPKIEQAVDIPRVGHKQIEMLAPKDTGHRRKPVPTTEDKDFVVKNAEEDGGIAKLKSDDLASEFQAEPHHNLTPKLRPVNTLLKALDGALDAPEQKTGESIPTNGGLTGQQKVNAEPSLLSSASSSTTRSPNLKRKRGHEDIPSPEDARSGPQSKKPTTSDIAKKRGQMILQYQADRPEREEKFPEDVLNYIDYGIYSMPIMCSGLIEHYHATELIDEPSNELKETLSANAVQMFGRKMLLLRRDALALSKKKFLTSKDLGRKDVHKTEPPRVVDDCDLYLYEGKIYIATELGLLLAADYLKLIGVPDSQPVRFNGYKPAWAKKLEAKQHGRRILQEFTPSAVLIKEGVIGLELGSTVRVYDLGIFARDPKTNEPSWMAYGVRNDGVEGWFPYHEETCRIDWCADVATLNPVGANGIDYSNMIDWSTFDYQPLADRAAAEYEAQKAAAAALRASLSTPALVSQPTTSHTTAAVSLVSKCLAVSVPSPDTLSPETAVPPTASSTPIEESNTEVTAEVSSTTTLFDVKSEESINLSSVVASPQSAESQEQTAVVLSVAGGPILRYDSAQDGSEKSASDQGDNDADGNEVGGDETDSLAAEEEALTEDASTADAIDKPALLSQVAAAKKLDEYGEDIVVDWDDDL